MNNVKKITKKELGELGKKKLFHIAEIENNTIVSKKLNIKNFLKKLSLENIERKKKKLFQTIIKIKNFLHYLKYLLLIFL